ncbi:MAG: hypothetical protein DMG22_07465 [Acidobacteria bacterium]|nr:MAG: hypothetical protein DMG22_07465 [Acidobacteriota bacterium]
MKTKVAPGGNLIAPNKFTGWLVYASAAVAGLCAGAYDARGIEISGVFRLLTYFGFLTLMSYWLQNDSKRSEAWRVRDFGFFMFLMWPLIVPYYLLKTRGARGLVLIVGFVGSYVVAFILSLLLIKK